MSYWGKLLRVNLSNRKITTESLHMDWAGRYFGGPGLGDKYLYEELKRGIDPLSADNKFIVATGPFTGTVIPCSGRASVITKSPLNGAILNSYMGGNFAPQLKFAGYDLLIIEGRAEYPEYLAINDNNVEIHDAASLWGKGTLEATSILRTKYGRSTGIITIGQGGENQLSIASIDSERRQAARGGPGAVLGSKNLKAIVCSGTRSVKVPNMPYLLKLIKKAIKNDLDQKANEWARNFGTPLTMDLTDAVGILPTRNFQTGQFEGIKKINADSMRTLLPQKKACYSCAICCSHYNTAKDYSVEGPEYETLAMCGANCGIDDLKAVIKFNAECDDLGIDTISTGNIVGFAMEMTEKGIKDFGIKFGDIQGYLKMPKLIANQRGVGQELAKGVRYLASKYGGSEFAMQVKGMELPGYDPRGSWGMGLAYATALRGGCHMPAWTAGDEALGQMDPFTIKGKAELVIRIQNFNGIKWSLPICDFWAILPDTLSELASCVLGYDVNQNELVKAGERIWNIGKLFNVREGFGIADDSLPQRFFKDLLKSGKSPGHVLPREEFDSMLQEYYRLREWNTLGVPTEAKIKSLEV